MNNNVITTSQNIKGDISSCTVSTQVVDSGRTLFTQDKTTIAINNCTGLVTEYHNWNFAGDSFGIGIVIIFVIFLGFGVGMVGGGNY